MTILNRLALSAAIAITFTSCGQSSKDAAQEAFNIMMESQEMTQDGDLDGAAARMADYNQIVQEHADDEDFCLELSRLVSEEAGKQMPGFIK